MLHFKIASTRRNATLIAAFLCILVSAIPCLAASHNGPPLGTRQDLETLRDRANLEPLASGLAHVDQWLAIPLNQIENPPDPLWSYQGQWTQEQAQFALAKYIATGDHAYADRAVAGFNEWVRVYTEHLAMPKYDGSSMRTSRQVQPQCMMYCVLTTLGLLNDQQRADAQKVLKLCATRLMERGKTFNVQDFMGPDFRNSNFNTDRIAAVGWYAMAFPDDPDSDKLIDHAVTEITWQLDNAFLPDGAWPEGTRYQGGVMRAIIPLAFGLRQQRGIDLFAHPMLRRAIEFPMHVQTPRDRTVQDTALTPGVGDAQWENQWAVPLAWGAKAYEKSDPEFAARLMWGWKRAGSPLLVEMSPGDPLVSFLFVDPRIAAKDQPATKSEVLPSGLAILRSGFNTDDEQYFMTTYGTWRGKGGHGHEDRGGFSLYAFNTPLALHPGVGAYDETRKAWYVASKSQNLVQFNGKNVGVNGTIGTWFDEGNIAYMDIDLTASAPGNYHRRILRLDSECYLIWDAIHCKGQAQYNLHVLGKEKNGADSMPIRFECAKDVDLEVNVLSPENAKHQIESDPFPVGFFRADFKGGLPGLVYKATPRWLTVAPQSPMTDIITLLRPLRRSTDSPGKDDRIIHVDGKPSIAQIHTSHFVHQIFFADGDALTGDIGIISTPNDPAGRSQFCLINGTSLIAKSGAGIRTEKAATLIARPAANGGYDIHNLTPDAAKVKPISAGFESSAETEINGNATQNQK